MARGAKQSFRELPGKVMIGTRVSFVLKTANKESEKQSGEAQRLAIRVIDEGLLAEALLSAPLLRAQGHMEARRQKVARRSVGTQPKIASPSAETQQHGASGLQTSSQGPRKCLTCSGVPQQRHVELPHLQSQQQTLSAASRVEQA